jgi:hypothetical protein
LGEIEGARGKKVEGNGKNHAQSSYLSPSYSFRYEPQMGENHGQVREGRGE